MEQLNELKTDFNNIIVVRNNIVNVFDILSSRIGVLKELYSKFIKDHNQNIFVFGLDSFNFQSKMIDIEYDEMKRMFLAINNRMYCEYYKLLKLVKTYVKEEIKDKKIEETIRLDIFPQYKDLEPYKEYDYGLIKEVHENIISVISSIYDYIQNKEIELNIYKDNNQKGFNIDNFVITLNFNVNMMKEKMNLYKNFIQFFHRLHTKYLKRFARKLKLFFDEITNDIKFDENNSNKKEETESETKSIKSESQQHHHFKLEKEQEKSNIDLVVTDKNEVEESDDEHESVELQKAASFFENNENNNVEIISECSNLDNLQFSDASNEEETNEMIVPKAPVVDIFKLMGV